MSFKEGGADSKIGVVEWTRVRGTGGVRREPQRRAERSASLQILQLAGRSQVLSLAEGVGTAASSTARESGGRPPAHPNPPLQIQVFHQAAAPRQRMHITYSYIVPASILPRVSPPVSSPFLSLFPFKLL